MPNYNNLAQHINYVMGSAELNLPAYYLQTLSIPGISFSLNDAMSPFSTKIKLQADSISYNPLTLTMLLAEDFSNYHELMKKVFSLYNPETGVFAQNDFNLFIINNNLKGNFLFKVDFFGCKIESIDDIDLSANDDSIPVTFTCTINYDYYKFDYSDEGYRTAWKNLKQNTNDNILDKCVHLKHEEIK
jgi:hypothetical protein